VDVINVEYLPEEIFQVIPLGEAGKLGNVMSETSGKAGGLR
jgi:hypothetical protein